LASYFNDRLGCSSYDRVTKTERASCPPGPVKLARLRPVCPEHLEGQIVRARAYFD
jgi:hypothetical protein